MSTHAHSRRWLGPALAASLWFGIAPAPAPVLSAAEITAIWGHTGHQTNTAAAAKSPVQGQAPLAAPQGPSPASDPGR